MFQIMEDPEERSEVCLDGTAKKEIASRLTSPALRLSVILQLGLYSMPHLGRGQRTKCQAATQPITSAKLNSGS